jgi:hypothetical protein
MSPVRSNKYFYLFGSYIFALHLCPLLALINLLPGGKPAYIIDVMSVLPIHLTLTYWQSSTIKPKVSFLDMAVISYFFISVLSVVLYWQPNNPTDAMAYFYGFHYFVLPIFLYFSIKTFIPSQQYNLLRFICYLNVAAIIIGIILFFWRPYFYQAALEIQLSTSGDILEDWQIFGRMQSYLGSTALGTIIATTIILFTILDLSRKQVVILLPVMLFGILLVSQRGGFLATLIALLYTLFKIKGSPAIKIILPVMSCILLLVGIVYYYQLHPEIFNLLSKKYSLASMYDAFDFGELRGYKPGMAYVQDFPFGVGLGATSSVADSMGLATRGQVVDANFMRILADLGMLGLFSFLTVLLAASIAALKKPENAIGWLLLFGLIVAICIGTNTLDSYYISHIFWLFLGVIDTRISPKIQSLKY